jgi:hypothetical protein
VSVYMGTSGEVVRGCLRGRPLLRRGTGEGSRGAGSMLSEGTGGAVSSGMVVSGIEARAWVSLATGTVVAAGKAAGSSAAG